ncbi:hypothetical protein HW130_03305 [Streptomyces sp. PKU-EA00015]|uniref:hypothetical protein n=1 Tax=Streptomyces sp. PKU-EA00015 TaxID=2748326 RepID=UPI0015A10DBC|nr:hypothetical protein [Streptomyces sp. PKU-EA00015]NWF25300.1 hypothetical protein [Streptomyces sp. PKU-EA00015]
MSIIPVPVPDRVVDLIQDAFPESICQAVMAAEDAKREALLYRPLACTEDRADREVVLSRLARANKVLAAYDPRLMVTPKAVAA